jgi:hypothetical protein
MLAFGQEVQKSSLSIKNPDQTDDQELVFLKIISKVEKFHFTHPAMLCAGQGQPWIVALTSRNQA